MNPAEQPTNVSQAGSTFRLDLSQAEFERAFFHEILRRDPDQLDALRRQAELCSRLGDLAAAVQLDERLAVRCPNDCLVHYNLACSLALNEQVAAAICSLGRAIELGYDDIAHIEADADLDNLRDEPAFQQLLRRWDTAE